MNCSILFKAVGSRSPSFLTLFKKQTQKNLELTLDLVVKFLFRSQHNLLRTSECKGFERMRRGLIQLVSQLIILALLVRMPSDNSTNCHSCGTYCEQSILVTILEPDQLNERELIFIHSGGNWASEKVLDLPEVEQKLNGRAAVDVRLLCSDIPGPSQWHSWSSAVSFPLKRLWKWSGFLLIFNQGGGSVSSVIWPTCWLSHDTNIFLFFPASDSANLGVLFPCHTHRAMYSWTELIILQVENLLWA